MKKILYFLCFISLISTVLLAVEEIKEVDLNDYEKKFFSQNGEDGVISGIFELIGSESKYFVEFGVENGSECNTRFLREREGWTGLMMDGGFQNLTINLNKEYITKDNINDLFEKYSVPKNFDLLSIDIDSNDFYVWHQLDTSYRPKLVVIEYNSTFLPGEDKVVLYNPNACWDYTNYFGASITALNNLAIHKGYTLVYAENRGVNLFFLRNDIVTQLPFKFKNAGDVSKLYKYPFNFPGNGPNGGHPADPLEREHISSLNILDKF